MKKLFYLCTMVLTLMILNTSCSKDEVSEPKPKVEPIITLNELYGYWSLQTIEYEGNLYSECEDFRIPIEGFTEVALQDWELTPISEGDEGLGFNIRNIIHYTCSGTVNHWLDCELDEEHNTFEIGNGLIYQVLSYNKSTKILIMKKIKPETSLVVTRTYYKEY